MNNRDRYSLYRYKEIWLKIGITKAILFGRNHKQPLKNEKKKAL